MAQLTIDPAFGWVLLECAIIGLHVIMQGYASMPIRKKLFTKAFYEKNFPELLKQGRLPEAGYPDMGGGQFSNKLSMNEWMEFSNAQRAHYNYLEGVASILVFLLISGLFFPRYTSLCGITYIVGRVLYGVGYKAKGSRGRLLGVLVLNVGLFAALCGAFYGSFSFAGGLSGLKALIGV